MSKNDGGPAYPSEVRKIQHHGEKGGWQEAVPATSGMSLRDYFAGQALAGLTANASFDGKASAYAPVIYQFADAMIAERDKGEA